METNDLAVSSSNKDQAVHGAPLSSERGKQLVLLAAIMGSSVVALDATVVSVALPAIRGDLGGGLAGQQWISNGYLVALGSLILIGGSLGDVFGERRIFAIGVAGFGLVSALCALAPNIDSLIAARVLQGVFGALLTPSALAVIVAAFPVRERGAAIGSWTAWSSIATVLGPLLGGYLVTAVSWRLIFALNVPLSALTLLLVLRAVPARRAGEARVRVDWIGGALALFGLAGVLLALIREPSAGWTSPDVVGSGFAGLALLAAFVGHERRAAHPMLPLELFRRRNFAVGNAQTFVMYCGFGVVFFYVVLFVQQVAGYSALQAGLAVLPASVIMFAFSKRVGRLADRFGAHLFIGLGPLVAAAGILLLTKLQVPFDYATELLPGWVLLSCGVTATFAPLTATVLASADASNAGTASGVNNAISRISWLLGVAAVGAVMASVFGSTLDKRLEGVNVAPAAHTALAQARRQTLARVDPATVGSSASAAVTSASVDAFHLGVGVAAGLVACGGIMGLIAFRRPRRRVLAEDCAAAQFVAQPLDAALQDQAGRVTAVGEAVPT